jgi:O-acetyl-ADP-ribose deacetylase (regulator of RNase III)
MLNLIKGNILEADAEALVNTVNCVGVMGKGIALQFKNAFPENFQAYERACRHNEIQPGRMFVFRTNQLYPKYIINFPTKRDWKNKSRLEDIENGLAALIKEIKSRDIKSIAIPPLGCGSGRLRWAEVGPLIAAAMSSLPEVRAFVYPPVGAPEAESMPIRTNKPEMTRARAILIRLIEQYAIPGYQLTLLEIQKLAYFLQAAGEKLKLKFSPNKYGPYAENMHHILQRLEGHYIRGYGDRTRHAVIRLLPFAVEPAQHYLAEDSEAQKRLERVSRLIEGFETPYGMELLSTVHWTANEDPQRAADPDWVVERVHKWSARKSNLFTPNHVHKALERLRSQDWIAN